MSECGAKRSITRLPVCRCIGLVLWAAVGSEKQTSASHGTSFRFSDSLENPGNGLPRCQEFCNRGGSLLEGLLVRGSSPCPFQPWGLGGLGLLQPIDCFPENKTFGGVSSSDVPWAMAATHVLASPTGGQPPSSFFPSCSPPSPSLQRALRLDSVACLSVPGNFLERERKSDERKFSCFLLFWYKEVAHIKAVRIVQ